MEAKTYGAPSVFEARNLLREARRQKHLADQPVPAICLLDPDGDVVRRLAESGRGQHSKDWACYHTELVEFRLGSRIMGAIGRAVGAAFAVLIAEELFASGCELLVSMTSAGRLAPVEAETRFMLIDRALRDEGTSYHYVAPAMFSRLEPALGRAVETALERSQRRILRGGTWTTDAPFRETESAIARARGLGLIGVEMEAAALYAFATACSRRVICFAHLTNEMAQTSGDFEKGEDEGLEAVLEILAASAAAWDALQRVPDDKKGVLSDAARSGS